MEYVLGTRGSRLALAQADFVKKRLMEAYPEHAFIIRVIQTTGDKDRRRPLHEIGGKGVFVKEIEQELLKGTVDIGVHSMKDMPSMPADGLMFTKAWAREDPRDALILREKGSLAELERGAVIGTGSRRRELLLKRLRPDLTVVPIRGNVDTRLKKMEEKRLDGIVLAAAGLKRLGLLRHVTEYLKTEEFLPAPAQGVLALEIRKGDTGLLHMLNALCDEETACAVEAERGFLAEIGGDCHAPAGAFCRKKEDGSYSLSVLFENSAGSRQAFATVCGPDPKALAKEAAAKIRQQVAGMVSLVGAGPGDPGLITVKGLAAVREADCILYDRLSSPELLQEAKPGCERIYVGKESHRHTMRQEEINRLMVQKSMEHEKIVRLKGGDVYVLGRGGEEGLYLREHGVPFTVVPGITSAVAAPLYAGIPVTHRGLAGGFHVVTAHDRKDGLAEIDFAAMAKGTETCIFLMGLSRVGEIAKRLIEAGMPDTMQAAVISHAASPEQRTCVSDLKRLAEEVRRMGLDAPAVIVVGKVVALRDALNVLERQPFSGRRYLIPKIGRGPIRLQGLLRKKGAAVDEIQVGEIVYLKQQLFAEELREADWLVFTSKNGVESFFGGMAESGLDMRELSGCKIAAIGKQTADVLKKHGLYADLMPERFDGCALAEELRKHLSAAKEDGRQKEVCYFKAANADCHFKEALKDVCRFTEISLYENRAIRPDFTGIRPPEEYVGVLYTCASSAERFLEAAGQGFRQCESYSIGPKTTECLRRYGVDPIEAEQATYEGMAELLPVLL